MSIVKAVEEHGWDEFRNGETAMLEKLLKTRPEGAVLVFGAGVVEREVNRKLLKKWAYEHRGPIVHVARNPQVVSLHLSKGSQPSTHGHLGEHYESGKYRASLPTCPAACSLSVGTI